MCTCGTPSQPATPPCTDLAAAVQAVEGEAVVLRPILINLGGSVTQPPLPAVAMPDEAGGGGAGGQEQRASGAQQHLWTQLARCRLAGDGWQQRRGDVQRAQCHHIALPVAAQGVRVDGGAVWGAGRNVRADSRQAWKAASQHSSLLLQLKSGHVMHAGTCTPPMSPKEEQARAAGRPVEVKRRVGAGQRPVRQPAAGAGIGDHNVAVQLAASYHYQLCECHHGT